MTTILLRLSDLAGRFDSKFPTNAYPFPFASVVRFVRKHIAACPRDAVAPAMEKLLGSIRAAVAHDLAAMKGYGGSESKSLASEPGRWFKGEDRAAIAWVDGWLQHHETAE